MFGLADSLARTPANTPVEDLELPLYVTWIARPKVSGLELDFNESESHYFQGKGNPDFVSLEYIHVALLICTHDGTRTGLPHPLEDDALTPQERFRYSLFLPSDAFHRFHFRPGPYEAPLSASSSPSVSIVSSQRSPIKSDSLS